MPNAQLAVWRNGGSITAETAMQFLKFRSRAKLSEPATYTKPSDVIVLTMKYFGN